jgi:hypothetical protein
MPRAAPQRHCVYCPDCGKEFKNATTLLQHANQPLGRCRSFGRRSHARVLAIAARVRRRPSPPLEPSCSVIPLDSQVPAAVDIDNDIDNVNDNDSDIRNKPDKLDSDPPDYSIHPFPNASQDFRGGNTFLDQFDADVYAPRRSSNVHYPFADLRDWEMAQWLTLSGLSMHEVDKFLSIRLVCLLLLQISVLTPSIGSRPSALISQCKGAKETNRDVAFWPALEVHGHSA